MYTDICFPSNNEEEYIRIAQKIKLGGLLFIYPADTEISKIKERLKEKSVKLYYGALIESDKDLNKTKTTELLVSDLPIRQFIESKKIKLHYGFESYEKKDSLHYRKSGLEQVVSKIFYEKEKIYGFSHSLILNARNKPLVFGRMMQNIRLLQKYKNNIFIGSFAKSPYELRSRSELVSFGVCLGLTPNKAKESVKLLANGFLA
ncbi:MAG: RNase P subunit p30 family protein [archaeon]